MRRRLESVADAVGVSLEGAGTPLAIVRTAHEQELAGTSADAPVLVIWDNELEGGGGDPFSHGLCRHLLTREQLSDPEAVRDVVDALAGGASSVRDRLVDDATEQYRTRLVDAQARPSLEAAIVNDLTRVDADGHASARVIKSLVALMSLASPSPRPFEISWPVRARFGASDESVWLSLQSDTVISTDAVLSEMSRGYHGTYRQRERSRIPALGWFFALRQVDQLGICTGSRGTELFATWDCMPRHWSWKPALHLSVEEPRAWRRARRYRVKWDGELRGGALAANAEVIDLSSLGAFVRVNQPRATLRESEPVALLVELPSPRRTLHLNGAVRYVDERVPETGVGIGIEFEEEAQGLGHALERFEMAG
ncbi:MAG: PilZ domain-containing protein [Myxococcota bacterium]